MLTLKKIDVLDKPYKIYADYVESAAIDQFVSAMQQVYVKQGALMPDAHSGYSLPIGAVVACEDVVVPAYVGYDIGCGMCAVPTSFTKEDVIANNQAIFDAIYKVVPVVIRTVVEVEADNGSCAEDIVRTRAADVFTSVETRCETDTPVVKSAYEATVTFYLDAFTHEEVEERICELIRKGSDKSIGLGFDIEAIKQGGPCRG